VRILGSFPNIAYVWFGDQPGIVLSQSSNAVDVLTPVRGVPGTVDVTLVKQGSGATLTVPQAFTFFDPTVAGPQPPSGPSPSDPVEPTDPGDPAPSPTDPTPTTTTVPGTSPTPGDPSDPTPTTTLSPVPTTTWPGTGPSDPTDPTDPSDPGDPGTAPAPTTTAPGDVSSTTVPATPTTLKYDRQGRLPLGEPVQLPNGLWGRPVLSGSPFVGAAGCVTTLCEL